MPWQLTRNQLKEIFIQAVLTVADVNNTQDPRLESYSFQFFQPFHKTVFLTNLKYALNNCILGDVGDQYCIDITLNEKMFDEWDSFGDCISFILTNQRALAIKDKVKQFKWLP